ncbi:hypothetical protein OG205_09345 [Lentzea sp. NBC_00516]|uniref:hypothetical protein n=1 Tax=Lentzea sp. NBC_00516 TaxID=2903582 RepID=UPI002E819DB3|nr:hypothetical protein [Lentzea sp. NBC_00516]WUD27179.1 hypothetical protein OG205_09345 [Lentzea sp. NBC_00516]
MTQWPVAMRLARDGTMTLVFADGSSVSASLGKPGFCTTSMIDSSIYFPAVHHLQLKTIRGHDISVELPRPDDQAPLGGRTSIYLDQNHWSTLAKTIHDPSRVPNARLDAEEDHLLLAAR